MEANLETLYKTLHAKGEVTQEMWDAHFEELDKDKDGFISRKDWSIMGGETEFFDAIKGGDRAKQMISKKDFAEAFKLLDLDKDGKLTPEEFAEACKLSTWTKGEEEGEGGLKLEDTNMAGVGGEEDRALKKAAAQTEAAWHGVGLEPGLWIWRIEQFKVVAWPREKYGKFHEGDSYICLKTEQEISAETGQPTDKLLYDIHFWLGKKTSLDEKGTAAYKTVELDGFFDDQAVQHREVQGLESEEFIAFFPSGVEYLEGGVETGFKVTQNDIFITKLWQVRRNKKKAIIIEEEQVALATLNHRDSFILRLERKIYVWDGDSSNAFIKRAANARAEQMESESNGELTATHDIDDAFWEALGGKGEVTAADAVGEEVAADFGEGVLYSIQVSDDEKRSLSVKEVGRGDLKKEMLDTTGVMMVDTRDDIFLWLGAKSSNAEKGSAFATATNYLKMNDRDPDKTGISILKEGFESRNKRWMEMFP